MTGRKWILWLVFLDFSAFSFWVLWQVGYFGIWSAGLTDIASMQLLFDLVVSCVLISIWLKNDAAAKGMNPYPWMIAIFLTGSWAVLIYLLVREYRKNTLDHMNWNTI